jgi:hypothetical protein
MKQTKGIELPTSFLVAASHRATEMMQAAPADHDILTVAEVGSLLKCKPSSIYNLIRTRTRDHS